MCFGFMSFRASSAALKQKNYHNSPNMQPIIILFQVLFQFMKRAQLDCGVLIGAGGTVGALIGQSACRLLACARAPIDNKRGDQRQLAGGYYKFIRCTAQPC